MNAQLEIFPALRKGSMIEYRGAWGSGPLTTARVTGFGEKNDRPLVDLDDGHWAYLTQIVQVLS